MRFSDSTLVVFREKHGERFFHVKSEEEFGKACLKVLRERFTGGWYGSREEVEREKPKPPEIADEEAIAKLPGQLREFAAGKMKSYKKSLFEWERNSMMLGMAAAAAKDGDQKMAAKVIEWRRDYEYEGYDFLKLEEVP
jgi:hypothetical protein